MIIEDATPATVTFVINGEVTSQMTDGETEILKDGTLIGISDIILNEAGEAGSGDIVELYIGATKVQFKDNDYSDGEQKEDGSLGYEQNVEIDEESIEDAFVQIKGNELSTSGDKFEISSIRYRLSADALPGYKDLWVPPGDGVREFLDEPQGLLGASWDIRYEGLDDTGVSMIKVDPSGDDEYNLEFENKQGTVYRVPYITNKGGNYKFGDDDKDLVFIEGNFSETTEFELFNGTDQNNGTDAVATQYTMFNIGILDYFVLSDANKNTGGVAENSTNGVQGIVQDTGGGTGIIIEESIVGGFDDTATTHIVRYNSIDTSDRILSFDEEGSGTKEFTYENLNEGSGATIGKARLIFGGNTYVTYIGNATSAGSDNPLAVDMDGDIDRTEIRLTINGGGIVDLGEAPRSDGGNFTYGGTDAQSS